jgi:hypothetical protein
MQLITVSFSSYSSSLSSSSSSSLHGISTLLNSDFTYSLHFFPRSSSAYVFFIFIVHSSISIFFHHVKYLGVIIDKKITWRLHIEMTEAKAFRTYIRIYSLFKNERLSANIKLILHKTLIRSAITYFCHRPGIFGRHLTLKSVAPVKKILRATGNYQDAHWSAICTRFSTFRMYAIV